MSYMTEMTGMSKMKYKKKPKVSTFGRPQLAVNKFNNKIEYSNSSKSKRPNYNES